MDINYTIVSLSRLGDTIITKVEYTFDGSSLTLDVSHFRPTSLADIEQGIVNRALSEKSKMEAVAKCQELMATIETNVEQVIE